MSPEAVARQYRAVMAQGGEAVTLSRAGVPNTFGPVLSRVTEFRADGQMYDLQQGERILLLLAADVVAAGFPLPFQANKDRIAWSGGTLVVKSVDAATRRVAGVTIAFEAKVAGA